MKSPLRSSSVAGSRPEQQVAGGITGNHGLDTAREPGRKVLCDSEGAPPTQHSRVPPVVVRVRAGATGRANACATSCGRVRACARAAGRCRPLALRGRRTGRHALPVAVRPLLRRGACPCGHVRVRWHARRRMGAGMGAGTRRTRTHGARAAAPVFCGPHSARCWSIARQRGSRNRGLPSRSLPVVRLHWQPCRVGNDSGTVNATAYRPCIYSCGDVAGVQGG